MSGGFARAAAGVITSPWAVLAGMGIGAYIGLRHHEIAAVLAPYGELYLSLIKMCVLPIMIVALISSLGRLLHAGLGKRLLRRLVIVFGLGLLLVSLLGTTLGAVFGPGRGLDDQARLSLGEEILRVEENGQPVKGSLQPERHGLMNFLEALVPTNVFEAASAGNSLPVVFFCVLVGLALGSLRGAHADTALDVAEAVYDALIRLIGWIMYGLPLGLTCLVAANISRLGSEILAAMAGLLVLAYVGAFIQASVYTALIAWRIRKGPLAVLRLVKEPIAVALGTSSSFASIPAALRSVHKGMKRDRVGSNLVIPLGMTLNPHGNVLYFALAALFFAQLYGQSMGLEQYVTLVLGAILASMAASGAPGIAALGMLALILEPLGLPVAVAIILLTAVDPIVDPILTTLNVYGNCASTALIAEAEHGDGEKQGVPGTAVLETE